MTPRSTLKVKVKVKGQGHQVKKLGDLLNSVRVKVRKCKCYSRKSRWAHVNIKLHF